MNDDIHMIERPEFPVTLKNMKSPPRKLYVRGKMPENEDQRYLCIIGSRRYTNYGRDAVNKIVKGLQGYPITIVSGLAIGIDSIAHMAALEAGLNCAAFPGSSLEWDRIYPPSRLHLAHKIVESGGALISRWNKESPMGKWAFPYRNTLMAGLADATLIIEASRGSGSLMTAKYAEDFDRIIMAVPGPINNAQSYGPHMLLKRGAVLVESADDILQEFGFETRGRDRNRDAEVAKLDDVSSKIFAALSLEQLEIDELALKIGLESSVLNEKLSLLELQGLIKIEGVTAKIA